MGAKPLKLAGHEIAGDDTLGLTVYKYKIQHLVTRV